MTYLLTGLTFNLTMALKAVVHNFLILINETETETTHYSFNKSFIFFVSNLSTLSPEAEVLVMICCFFRQVVLMLLEKNERLHVTQLFEHLSAVQSTEFTKNDVQNLANKYI